MQQPIEEEDGFIEGGERDEDIEQEFNNEEDEFIIRDDEESSKRNQIMQLSQNSTNQKMRQESENNINIDEGIENNKLEMKSIQH